MQKYILFLLPLLALFHISQAQTDSIRVWNKWCARKDTMLLFTGGNNQIQVYCPTLKPTEIKLRSLDKSLRIGGEEVKGDTLNTLAMPFPDKGKQMRLAILNKKTLKQIKVVTFSCDSIPQLKARLGNITASEAKRKEIQSQAAMKAYFPKSLYSYPYTIKQYTFHISTPKGGATIPVKGFLVPNSILKEIGEAPENTVVDFTDIKATCPDCATRPLDNIKMKIK